MKKIALVLLCTLMPALAFSQLPPQQVNAAVKAAGGAKPFIKEMVRQSAEKFPMMINKNVEVRSVASNGLQMTYMNRLINVEKKDVYDLDALKKANVNYFACSSPVLGILIKDYDAEIIYMATARGTEFLFQYNLNRSTCRGK